jgi:hypothetical protein
MFKLGGKEDPLDVVLPNLLPEKELLKFTEALTAS